jgi:hypothetical protein
MLKFAVIAEGSTDQQVIRNILLGYFEKNEENEEPVITYLHPPEYIKPKPGVFVNHESVGGWGKVFNYLKSGKYKDPLSKRNYLIIQIDTDVSGEKGFDVAQQENGQALAPEELARRVIERLQACIEADILAEYGHRFIFAISVHAIECWLLPLIYLPPKKTEEKNKKYVEAAGAINFCCRDADNELRRRNKSPLKKEQNSTSYEEASRGYQKEEVLRRLAPRNPSLKLFIESLDRLFLPSTTS